MDEHAVVGKRYPRSDGIARVTGTEHADELACGGAQVVGGENDVCVLAALTRGES